MNPLTEARHHVAALLTGTGVTVHPEPPETVGGTCLVLAPGQPWASRKGLAGCWLVVVDITVLVPVSGGRGMLARVEDLAVTVATTPGLRPAPGQPLIARAVRQQWSGGDYFAATVAVVVEVVPETGG
jgi:hypothetical protein